MISIASVRTKDAGYPPGVKGQGIAETWCQKAAREDTAL
jgi:hypothetical protein